MRVFNEQPRPRCLLLGTLDDGAITDLRSVFPTLRKISDLGEVRQAEWDVLVTGEGFTDLDPHLFVVAFGEGSLGAGTADAIGSIQRRRHHFWGTQGRPISVATHFASPAGTPARYARLVESDLLPRAIAETDHSCIVMQPQPSAQLPFPLHEQLTVPGLTPLLSTADGIVLAGWFTRPRGEAVCLSLPENALVVPWVTAAVSEWHAVDRVRFPASPDWTSSTAWLTPSEQEAEAELAALGNEERAVLADIGRRRIVAAEHRAAAESEAISGPRRLLTSTGASLVEAVLAALEDLGFAVKDMDQVWPEGDFREDLRVSDPGSPGGVIIAEVKGYSKSRGKAEDLIKLSGRFAPRFQMDEGAMPVAQWYIVNQAFADDPGTRKPLFDNSPGDLDAFGSVGGLAIDSADLFRLWTDVVRGEVKPEDARRLLLTSTGRLVLPPPST